MYRQRRLSQTALNFVVIVFCDLIGMPFGLYGSLATPQCIIDLSFDGLSPIVFSLKCRV